MWLLVIVNAKWLKMVVSPTTHDLVPEVDVKRKYGGTLKYIPCYHFDVAGIIRILSQFIHLPESTGKNSKLPNFRYWNFVKVAQRRGSSNDPNKAQHGSKDSGLL